MGHALNDTIQDILTRYHHLRGYNTLWVVGTDHAGIATQNKVEGQLAGEGLRKEDLGREEFEKRVWKWRGEYGSTIIHQLKRLGCACDYESERFTMDEGYREAVAKVFVDLYKKGDIYRDVYLVNWCTRCGSAISDLEVEHEDRAAKLYHVKYPVAGLRRVPDGGHHPPGDHPGRHRRGREPQGPALRPPGGQVRRRAAHRARGAHHRRRARGHRLRHRRSQDHPGARPGRLRDRHAPRPAQHLGHRAGRAS